MAVETQSAKCAIAFVTLFDKSVVTCNVLTFGTLTSSTKATPTTVMATDIITVLMRGGTLLFALNCEDRKSIYNLVSKMTFM